MEDNLVVRQTYIMLAVKDNIKYIFNRSVRWDSIINCKNIQPLLNLLGEDVIKHFSESLFENNTEKMDKAINSFTRGFLGDYPLGYLKTIDDVDLFVIQILPFENINRSDQQEINKVKNDLCEKFDAKCVKDDFIGDKIDKVIGNNIKKNFKQWLNDIYIEISKYSKTILDNEVIDNLKTTRQSLEDEYNRKKDEYVKKLSKLCNESNVNKEIIKNQKCEMNKLKNEIDNLENERNKLLIELYNLCNEKNSLTA